MVMTTTDLSVQCKIVKIDFSEDVTQNQKIKNIPVQRNYYIILFNKKKKNVGRLSEIITFVYI